MQLKAPVVRWLAAFRGREPATVGAWLEVMLWECAPTRDRAAEPLWRGRSVVGPRTSGLGLGYDPDAVRIVRSADCWSEPVQGDLTGRLTLRRSVPRRAWRNWDAFARVWARRWPGYHAEAWLGQNAEPTCLVVGTWVSDRRVELARTLSRRLQLPVVRVRPLED
jgi:hypothetical protein